MATSVLAGWDAAQQRAADALDEAAAAAAPVMAELLASSCLVELAKLAAARITVAGYVDGVVALLSQFLPVDAVGFAIVAHGVAIGRTSGAIADIPLDARRPGDDGRPGMRGGPPLVVPMRVGGRAVGTLAMRGLSELLAATDLLTAIGEGVGGHLGRLLELEFGRRASAESDAISYFDDLNDWSDENRLDEACGHLAMLPAATGATIEFAVDDATYTGQAGRTSDRYGTSRSRSVLDDGKVIVRLIVAADPEQSTPSQQALVARVVEAAARSAERFAQARRDRQASERDPDTGLPDRRAAARALVAAIRAGERRGEPVALAVLTPERPRVGNTPPPAVDPQTLVDLATTISAAPGVSLVGRNGGDRLLIVAPGHDRLGMTDLTRHLTEVVKAAKLVGRIGVAVFPDDGGSADALLRFAIDQTA